MTSLGVLLLVLGILLIVFGHLIAGIVVVVLALALGGAPAYRRRV